LKACYEKLSKNTFLRGGKNLLTVSCLVLDYTKDTRGSAPPDHAVACQTDQSCAKGVWKIKMKWFCWTLPKYFFKIFPLWQKYL